MEKILIIEGCEPFRFKQVKGKLLTTNGFEFEDYHEHD